MTTSILPQRNATHDAPQHGPRPLPLFLEMLRSETATDPDRMARALAGLRRYQHAPRPKPGRAARRHGVTVSATALVRNSRNWLPASDWKAYAPITDGLFGIDTGRPK